MRNYARSKLIIYIKDVAQSFEIAGIKRDIVPCLGAVLMHAAVVMALRCGASKADVLRYVSNYYDEAKAKLKKKGN